MEPRDANGLLELEWDVRAEAKQPGQYGFASVGTYTPRQYQRWAQDATSLAGASMVAEAQGTIVGWLRTNRMEEPRNHVAEFEVWVHPSSRRRGVGTQLLGAAIDWATKSEIAKLSLEVLAENKVARRLYASFGFREEGIYSGRLRQRSRFVDVIPMGLHLTQSALMPAAERREDKAPGNGVVVIHPVHERHRRLDKSLGFDLSLPDGWFTHPWQEDRAHLAIEVGGYLVGLSAIRRQSFESEHCAKAKFWGTQAAWALAGHRVLDQLVLWGRTFEVKKLEVSLKASLVESSGRVCSVETPISAAFGEEARLVGQLDGDTASERDDELIFGLWLDDGLEESPVT